MLSVAVVGCGEEDDTPAPRPPAVVSVARPITPERVDFPGPGAIELEASAPGERGRPTWFAVVVSQPRDRARDVCVGTGIRQQDLTEASDHCDVSTGREAVFFVDAPSAASPTVVSGVAPSGVRAVRVEGPGGTHRLPLSAHRGFMAIYSPRARGRVRIVSELEGREVQRAFDLPLPRSAQRSLRHRHRRRGAVFNDEVGETITQRSYSQVVRRFGPPAVVREERGLRCAYYEVVGFPDYGWRFCFTANGRMDSATGNRPPP